MNNYFSTTYSAETSNTVFGVGPGEGVGAEGGSNWRLEGCTRCSQ